MDAKDIKKIVAESGLFDKVYYAKTYKDVRSSTLSSLDHYCMFGIKEDRKPNAEFDPAWYREYYADVKEAGIYPFLHYIWEGRKEKRFCSSRDINQLVQTDECEPYKKKYFIQDAAILEKYKENLFWINSEVAFDEEFYLANNVDICECDLTALEHYLVYGWREKRKPTEWFDPDFYLLNNKDVKECGIEPLTHYLMVGKSEGRLPSAINSDNDCIAKEKAADIGDMVSVIASEFDEDYYLLQYEDIRIANVNPLEHFLHAGWREGRRPNQYFDTNFYLNSNPDIRDAGVNPLYHFIISGRLEGRMAVHPAGYKAEVLHNLKNIDEQKKSWKIKYDTPSDKEELLDVLKSKLNDDIHGIVFSLGHDKYINYTGGVQLCISEEQQILSGEGFVYINLSPAQPLQVLSGVEGGWVGNIIMDGKFVGVFKSEDIIGAISELRNEYFYDTFLILHALHGHCVEFIIELAKIIEPKDSYVWIHDYFTVCLGYNLLRNSLSYCSAPDVTSQGCRICIYGEERSRHLQKIEKLFCSIRMNVLAPSAHALKLWKSTTSLPYISAKVLEHRNIKFDKKKQIGLKKTKLKIAFLGHPALHKGWEVFQSVYNLFKEDERYEFYHLGLGKKCLGCNFVEVRSTWENLEAMTDAIVSNEIDIVFMWSIWPETYNITTYEALTAGAVVITCKESGNIADEILKNKKGIVYETEFNLIEDMKNDGFRAKIRAIYKNGIFRGVMTSSGITAPLIQGKGKA